MVIALMLCPRRALRSISVSTFMKENCPRTIPGAMWRVTISSVLKVLVVLIRRGALSGDLGIHGWDGHVMRSTVRLACNQAG